MYQQKRMLRYIIEQCYRVVIILVLTERIVIEIPLEKWHIFTFREHFQFPQHSDPVINYAVMNIPSFEL